MNVTNSGSGAYIIDGASNPTLTVVRGVTYTFEINATGHPFWLQTTSGAYNSLNTYSTGVTNGGAQVGTITWQVAFNAPNTLYYVCQNHSSMNGQISVINAGPVIEVPGAGIQVAGRIPYILRPCVLIPPTPEPEPEPGNVISTPTPPGIAYEDLPVIDTVTQIVDTSPNEIIGCANQLTIGSEQVILNALFPAADSGDGVVNRENNDIWTYDGSTWSNVGPTPGRQLVITRLLPAYNEIELAVGFVRVRVLVESINYSLVPVVREAAVSIKIKQTTLAVILIEPPSAGFTLGSLAPIIVSPVIVPTVNLGITANPPVVSTAIISPVATQIFEALKPVLVGDLKTLINCDPVNILLVAHQPFIDAIRYLAPAASLEINLSINSGSASIFSPTIEEIVSVGNVAPLLGAASAVTSTGWTLIKDVSEDDAFIQTSTWPFTFNINSTGYTSAFVCANTYITFGSGSTLYTGLSQSVPNVSKIHFGAADNSNQRVYTQSATVSDRLVQRIRYEGTAAQSGTPGSSNIIAEFTFFEPFSDGRQLIELRFGNHSRPAGLFMIASPTTSYASSTVVANTSWVFIGNSTGTSWTMTSNRYVAS